jgi:single-stranded-DNA-specific exonuclease
MDRGEALLGVERSVLGNRWEQRECDERLAYALAQRHSLPEFLGRVMSARGIDLDSSASFLEPSIRALMPDPDCLKDMDKAVERVSRAVAEGQKIAIIGDYDVDGATSTSLLILYGRQIGIEFSFHIPDRMSEGYGPSIYAVEKLAGQGASVLITVDCGVAAYEPLEKARQLGLDTVILDHHVAEARLPEAYAVVNPNRLDDESGLGSLAAVGVTFLFLVGLNRQLRTSGFFQTGKQEPNLLGFLNLVALGTICDVVPLQGLNRAFAMQGLKVLGQRGNPGLAALADVAKVDERPTAYHAGFVFGPRINAGGRIGKSSSGTELLIETDLSQATALSMLLNDLNKDRQHLEMAILEEAVTQAEQLDEASPLIIVSGEGWHPGVIGIVASRLKDRFSRPALVIGLDGDTGKGSGRSMRGVDLGSAVIAARQKGLLEAGGGHAMAAGLTVQREKLPEFCQFLSEQIAKQLPPEGIVPRIRADGVLSPDGLTLELLEDLEKLEPFGAGNEEPRIVVSRARIERATVVGTNHVSCSLSGASGRRIKAIAFRAMDKELGPFLLSNQGQIAHFCGKIKKDTWQGKEQVQLFIDDAAKNF